MKKNVFYILLALIFFGVICLSVSLCFEDIPLWTRIVSATVIVELFGVAFSLIKRYYSKGENNSLNKGD